MLKQMIQASSWSDLLTPEFDKQYFVDLEQKVAHAYRTETVYPKQTDLFRVLKTPISDVRVVVLGQDPYINKGEATGLSFSRPTGTGISPSLGNIFNELQRTMPGFSVPRDRSGKPNANLDPWVKQGVFLLNTVLSVKSGSSNSHKDFGWQRLTSEIIKLISQHSKYCVFMLWGKPAQTKAGLVAKRHLILTSNHPSPLTSGFVGNNHFVMCNDGLKSHGLAPIDWNLSRVTMLSSVCTGTIQWNLYDLVMSKDLKESKKRLVDESETDATESKKLCLSAVNM